MKKEKRSMYPYQTCPPDTWENFGAALVGVQANMSAKNREAMTKSWWSTLLHFIFLI